MQNSREYKGLAIVISRTNYGEADRIIHFLTPIGVISAMARGSRREKSRLRGGCEPWALNEISVQLGKGLGTVKAARAEYLYEKIIYDFTAMEAAADVIKLLKKTTRDHDNPYFFQILREVLTELEQTTRHAAVILWAYLQITRAADIQLNLTHDADGEALGAEENYAFSVSDNAFVKSEPGAQNIYTARHIKLLRVATSVDLATFLKVDGTDDLLPLCMAYTRAQLQQ